MIIKNQSKNPRRPILRGNSRRALHACLTAPNEQFPLQWKGNNLLLDRLFADSEVYVFARPANLDKQPSPGNYYHSQNR